MSSNRYLLQVLLTSTISLFNLITTRLNCIEHRVSKVKGLVEGIESIQSNIIDLNKSLDSSLRKALGKFTLAISDYIRMLLKSKDNTYTVDSMEV